MNETKLGLAAVTLDPAGGGIATASRLMWQVVRDRWGSDGRLFTLLDAARGQSGLHPSTIARVRFGGGLGSAQALNQVSEVFYTHLSLAKVQRWLPGAFRKPYGIFLHGIEVWRPLSRLERRVLEGATLLMANSSYTARRVRTAHPWVGPIAECPLALPETAATASTIDRASVRAQSPTVIIVGRMSAGERYKGHDQLLEAWPAVRTRVPNARLVIVGEGDDVPRLRAKSVALGVGDAIVFNGFASEPALAALYRQAAVFAMPSREEGFGLVYLEAMAHGIPCIGSIHDAAGGVILDGVTGFLVDQADIAGLADRITQLLLDPALRFEMGTVGQRRVRDRFGYAAFRDRFLSLLTNGFDAPAQLPIRDRSAQADAPPRS